jgi:hypothetical protein
MTRRLGLLIAVGVGVCTGEAAFAAPPDLTGIWMPTAIAPDGERHRTWPESPPFLLDVQSSVDRYIADYDPVEDDAGRNCLPYGMPRQMLVVAQYPIEIIETEDQITILFELHNDARRIYLDQHRHPQGLLPTWLGHSIGHYEGDTLVVETTDIRRSALPRPSSPELKVTERFNLIDGGDRGEMMTVDMTIEDPLIYTEPFTVRNYFWRQTDIEMGEYFCSEDLWQLNLSGNDFKLPWR